MAGSFSARFGSVTVFSTCSIDWTLTQTYSTCMKMSISHQRCYCIGNWFAFHAVLAEAEFKLLLVTTAQTKQHNSNHIVSPLCMQDHTGGNVIGGLTSAVLKWGFPHFPIFVHREVSKWILLTSCTCFTFKNIVLSIMWFHTRCLYGAAKIFVYRLHKSHPGHLPLAFSLILSLLLLSSLMSSVSPLRPLRMNSALGAAVLMHSVVLLWQTIISEMAGQRELLFTTISP